MWLINCHTLKLEYFIGADIPPYTILSHTWGSAEDELTFADLRDGKGQHKPGYAKLEATARITLDLACNYEDPTKNTKLNYCWIDTCTINKESSAELTEAINSMFKWYQRSKMCIVYLADYTAKSDDEDITLGRLPLDIKDSRWFTRGWTLQELIAPWNHIFFDSEWKPLGVKLFGQYAPTNEIPGFSERWKGSMESSDHNAGVLEACTSIEKQVLRGEKEPRWVPVVTRMAWAASRVTTRIEDMAYCLMGLFGINMPLLYGEGKKSFLRLQENIMRSSSDLSLLAWSSESTRPSSMVHRVRKQRQALAMEPADFTWARGLDIYPTYRYPFAEQYNVTNRGIGVYLAFSAIPEPKPFVTLGYLGFLGFGYTDADGEAKSLAVMFEPAGPILEKDELLERGVHLWEGAAVPVALEEKELLLQRVLLVDELPDVNGHEVAGWSCRPANMPDRDIFKVYQRRFGLRITTTGNLAVQLGQFEVDSQGEAESERPDLGRTSKTRFKHRIISSDATHIWSSTYVHEYWLSLIPLRDEKTSPPQHLPQFTRELTIATDHGLHPHHYSMTVGYATKLRVLADIQRFGVSVRRIDMPITRNINVDRLEEIISLKDSDYIDLSNAAIFHPADTYADRIPLSVFNDGIMEITVLPKQYHDVSIVEIRVSRYDGLPRAISADASRRLLSQDEGEAARRQRWHTERVELSEANRSTSSPMHKHNVSHGSV